MPNKKQIKETHQSYLNFQKKHVVGILTTPRKINMEHNHGGLEDHFPF